MTNEPKSPTPSSKTDAGGQQATTPMATVNLAEGATLISERYRIEGELGRGGMGVVYRALDERMESRPVVIKVLLDKSVGKQWIERKFKDEMRALVRLNHPSVVGALDYGVLPDGQPYLVMELGMSRALLK
jgi:serine/threonine-protein kinase